MMPHLRAACCIVLLATYSAAADEKPVVAWRVHTIDADNPNSSGAMVDVNRDGQMDIVAGGFWYQGPTWKRHYLRDVEVIRGRNDDYSSLPVDVNGDGWGDLVSVNYRSKSLYWVEHPGKSLKGPWRRHVIDTPGSSETGMLADIDRDGQVDILPNGVKFAAWYRFERTKDGDATKVAWHRHELPKQLAGHGVGFGDLNGDGRGDIVGPTGWAEAPEDARGGRWIWHAGPALDRDGSIPILVHDVDGDGDNDLIWGRGHDFGLYWMERTGRGDADWKRHTIDESWSQAHAIRLADIDGDGHEDLVAGKRYYGHDGKDPGADDPMVFYWYTFDRKASQWRRRLIHESKKAATGLDFKVADADGDGDVDILCPDKAGLYLIENLRVD